MIFEGYKRIIKIELTLGLSNERKSTEISTEISTEKSSTEIKDSWNSKMVNRILPLIIY